MSRREIRAAAAHGPRCGFTLIEGLAALVLVAIVLPVAMRAISLALTMGSETARRTEATALAESKLSELLATGAWEDGSLEGDFTETPSGDSYQTGSQDRNATFRWSATSEDWLDQSVKELTVRVTWNARGTDREVVLTTLVYVPEAAQ
jgi:prepilin-type N-terminal cleavage/methylation domain-containing protein